MGSDDGAKSKLVGLPEDRQAAPSAWMMVPVLTIPTLIGIVMAKMVLTFGDEAKYSANIAAAIEAEQHWAFASVFALSLMVKFVNLYPTVVWKPRIMGGGNLRANPFIYQAVGAGAAKHAVVFVEDGPVGGYNRANRSLHHMIENALSVVAGLQLTSSIAPFPTFVLVASFALGRVLHQVGYTGGYGKHAPGFMISTLATQTIDGIVFLVAIRGILS